MSQQWLGAAIGAAGGALGMIGQKKREERQMGYQKDLMGLQYRNQQKLNEQGHELQMKAWRDTNYPAQMAMLKEAGLNPGLLYGMSGGGGVTTGSQGGGSAASGSAPNVPSVGMDIQNMMAAAQIASQIKLTNAQAKKVEEETENIAGVEREEGKTRIGLLIEQTKNEKAKTALTGVQTRIAELQESFMPYEFEYNLNKLQQEIKGETIRNNLTIDQYESLVEEAKQNAIGAAMRNTLMEAQEKGILKGIELDSAKIKEIGESITQKWTQLSQKGYELGQKDQQIAIDTFKAEISAEFPSLLQAGGKVINWMIEDGIEASKGWGMKDVPRRKVRE